MEYIEMAAAPKGMFDKMISGDSLRVPFNANGPVGTGYRPMPLPVFSHQKSLSSVAMAPVPPSGSGSELPRRGMPSFVTAGMPLKGSHMTLVSNGNGSTGGVGMMHLQLPGESGSSRHGDDLIEKGKRSRGEGGRGSRGGGTSSRKRTRAGQTDSLTTTETLPDGSLSGGAVASAGKASMGNGMRQRQNSQNGEKAEKSSSRRQSGQGAKRGDKKQSQVVVTSVNDPIPPKTVEANGVPNVWTSGILDIYGLRTHTMDIARFMVDIPLDDLLSGNFEVPSLFLKDNPEKKVELEVDFNQQMDSVLQLLPRRAAMAEAHSSRTGDTSVALSARNSKNSKMQLDLEFPLHPEEEEGAKAAKTERQTKTDFASPVEPEAAGERDVGVGSTAVVADGSFAQGPSRFAIERLPVHPLESFLSRLQLGHSDPLQSVGLPGADGEASVSADNRTNGDVVEVCRKNGSIPPLSSSYPPVGPFKTENGRYNQRIWIRGPAAEPSGRKSGSGSGAKEASDRGEEDAAENSPGSRRRKFDSKDQAQFPNMMHISSSGTQGVALGVLGPSNTVTPTHFIKEEPRHVDNAVGLSSEGHPNPMEIDSDRMETGSVGASGADGADSAQVVPLEHDRHRVGGAAVRHLELPTVAEPRETDTSSDRQSRPLTSTLADVKQEKVDQMTKDPGERSGMEGSGGGRLEPVASKQETLLDLPSLELKSIEFRSSTMPQDDPRESLPVMPGSPGAHVAADILCEIANSTILPADIEKIEAVKERTRRGFQSYSGAPTQRAAKSIRVTNSSFVQGDEGREGRRTADGGSVPPSKSFVSERRKSLSQVNDTPEKASFSSPRSSGAGLPTGPRGVASTGSRPSSLSVKLEKVASRESTKEPASIKEFIGRGSSLLPPLSNGGPSLKNGHKGVKTNSYSHSGNPKGNVAAANFARVPAACTTQRIVTGGTSSRSRTVHTGITASSHGPPPVPLKSSRHSIPESRQKTKAEVSGRGGKASRD